MQLIEDIPISWEGILPLLLGLLIILLIGLMTHGLIGLRKDAADNAKMSGHDNMMLGLAVLAVLAASVFLAVLVMTFVR